MDEDEKERIEGWWHGGEGEKGGGTRVAHESPSRQTSLGRRAEGRPDRPDKIRCTDLGSRLALRVRQCWLRSRGRLVREQMPLASQLTPRTKSEGRRGPNGGGRRATRGRGWQAGGWGTGHARGTKARRKPEKAAGGSGACADERQADFVSAHPRFARDSYISPLQPPPSSLLHFPFLPVARPRPPDAHRPPTPRPRSGGSLLHGPATSRHSCLIPVPSPIAATSVTTHPDYTS